MLDGAGSGLLPVLGQGMLAGLAIAAPVGPIGLLVLRRSVGEGGRAGFTAGLGAAAADGVYGLITAFGLGVADGFGPGPMLALRLIGAGMLLWLAWGIARAPVGKAAAVSGGFGAIFLLTLANPTTILSFLGLYAGLDPGGTAVSGRVVMGAGICLGSASWWLLLASIAGTMGKRLTPSALVWINRLSAAFLTGFALRALMPLVD